MQEQNKEPLRGQSGTAAPLPILAVSEYFATTPHLNGLKYHGQEVNNKAIFNRTSMLLFLELQKEKNSSRPVGLGKFLLRYQLFPQ